MISLVYFLHERILLGLFELLIKPRSPIETKYKLVADGERYSSMFPDIVWDQNLYTLEWI